LINEIPLDGVGGNEGIVIAIREGLELADAFVGKKDDVAPGEIVPVRVLAGLYFPSGVLGPCDLALLVLDAFDLFVATHNLLRFKGSMRLFE
jgi:hypothetical protein